MANKNYFLKVLTGMLLTSSAHAVSVGQVVGQVNPGRAIKSLETPLTIARARKSISNLPARKSQSSIPGAEKIKFKLNTLEFEGNSVFSNRQLRALFKDKLGKTISVADLFSMARTISVTYRKAGYVLSRAILPPQEIEKGKVKFTVIEGFVDDVKIRGKVAPSTYRLLMSYAEHIAAERPLRIEVLERYALLASDLPGISIRAVVEPSKFTQKASTLTFVVSQKFADMSVSYDNRGTRLLGPRQYTGSLHFNNLLGGSRTGLRSVVTERGRELRYFSGSHDQYIGSNGFHILILGESIKTKPDFAAIGLTGFGLNGKSSVYSAIAIYPIIRSRQKNLYVRANLEFLSSENSFSSILLSKERTRPVRLSGVFDYADSWLGVNVVSMTLSHGLGIFGASKAGSTTLSRLNARPDFTKLGGQLSRLQGLTHHFSVLLAGRGQYAFDPLLASEQFGVGGVSIGRGYDPSEILGDHGVAGSVEFRYDAQTKLPMIKKLQLYGFYDAGMIWNRRPVGQPPSLSTISAGGGVRLQASKYLDGHLEVTKPINRIVLNEGDRNTRVYFSLVLHNN